MSNELGGLDSAVGDIIKYGTDTIFFIHKHQVHTGRKATYDNAICDYRPLKYDPYCVQFTFGGNIIIYLGDPSTPAASLLESDTILNGKISTPGALFWCRHKNNIL